MIRADRQVSRRRIRGTLIVSLLVATLALMLTERTANAARELRVYYLSPTGRDDADGLSPQKPMRSFDRAFSRMRAGDELVLLDGVYSAAAGTGTMHWSNGSASAQIPSGTAARATVVRAQNPGAVTVQGPLFIGRSTRKDSYIRVEGITFEGGGSLYNTSFVTIKDSGFHGPFGIGTNDHDEGNTDNFVELRSADGSFSGDLYPARGTGSGTAGSIGTETTRHSASA